MLRDILQKNNEKKQNKICVLILSDRLLDKAKRMADFFSEDTEIHVIGIAKTLEEAMILSQNKIVHFLVIAGFLQNEGGYQTIAALQKENQKFLTVMWAMLDAHIVHTCKQYQIEHKYDRLLPLENFSIVLKYLYQIVNSNTHMNLSVTPINIQKGRNNLFLRMMYFILNLNKSGIKYNFVEGTRHSIDEMGRILLPNNLLNKFRLIQYNSIDIYMKDEETYIIKIKS